MTIDGSLLADGMTALLWIIMLAILAPTLRYADWNALIRVPARVHLLLGGAAFCVVLWLMSVRVVDGLWIHLLGMTALTLVLGWRFALIAGTLAVAIYTPLIGQDLRALPAAWLLTVAVPASVSRYLVYRLRQVKSRNLFIYMLGAGFGGGVLSVIAVAAAALPLLWLIGQRDWVSEAFANWPLIALLLFPEGFINGMVVTTLTVFYPQSVKTLDEQHYLDDR